MVAYNRSRDKTDEIIAEGLEGGFAPADVVAMLAPPRIVWLMVPAGDATEKTLEEFAALLAPGDTIVDGGNANFKDSKRRHAMLKERGINFVDAGISGGVWGLDNGYGTMVGGDVEAVKPLEPIFKALAPPDGGYVHCGPPGAGPLREDGPQRHRVRADAGLCRGLRDHARVGVPARPGGDRRGMDARHRHPVVAAGAARPRVRSSTARTWATSAARSRTPARAAGRSRRRSTWTSRRRSSPCR